MKRKLQRFSEIETFTNVFQKDCTLKGNWNTQYFQKAPIILELGCGRGEYTLALYQQNPERNYIGIDIKGARLWRGAKTAFEQKNGRIAFLRIQIESIMDYFSEDEVDEIWLTFPDPHLSERRKRKRLTNPRFLNLYRTILKKGGLMHLKTDSSELFHYTLETLSKFPGKIINQISDIHHQNLEEGDLLSVLTTYEKIFLKENKPIHYVCFQMPKEAE